VLNLIDEYPSIELIVSNNDAMALGAIDALVEKKVIDDINNDGFIDKEIEPWLPVIGLDGIEAAINSIDKGYLHMTVVNDTSQMAEAINQLSLVLLGEMNIDDLEFELENDKYIWIEYRPYEED